MITPELQKYIAEAQVRGTPDDVIRQNLIGQGWNPADVESALREGQASAGAASGGKGHTVLLVVIVSIVALLAAGGFVLTKVSQSVLNGKLPGLVQDFAEKTGDSGSGADISGRGGEDEERKCSRAPVASGLPSDWPTDLPKYPGSILTLHINSRGLSEGALGNALYCVDEDASEVVAYLIANGKGWNLSRRPPGMPEGFPIPETAGEYGLWGSQGDMQLMIVVEDKGAITEIAYLVGKDS